MIIGETLAYNARHSAEAEALICGNERRTWGELNEGANRFANALLGLGAEKGDRALMLIDNSIEFVEVYYGLAKIGVISAPSLPRVIGAEIVYIANDLRAKYIVAEVSAAAEVKSIQGQLETVTHVIGVGEGHGLELDYDALMREASTEDPAMQVAPTDLLTIKYTSGTTGSPKGCMRTHSNFTMAAAVYLFEMPLYDNDTGSITSPLAAGMAISELSRYVIRGTRMVMLPRFDAVQFMELIAREKITWGYAMDGMARRFCLHPDLDQADLSSLRAFSGIRDPGCMERLLAQKTFRAGFHTGYGSSESGGRISFKKAGDFEKAMKQPAKYGHIMDSLGREGRLYRMEAVDDDLKPMPVGEIGELAVRGPSVFQGYWERPEETAKVLRDGWLVTGDLCRRDAESYIYLAGRKRDMIKTGGINVYPAEIEPVLARHPKVAEVSVVGIVDEQWGEKVIACVVARGPVTEAELIEFCRDKLSGPKRPKTVHFLDKLPVNESGKVVKKDLIEMLTTQSRNE